MSTAALPRPLASRDLPRRVLTASGLVALLDIGYAAPLGVAGRRVRERRGAMEVGLAYGWFVWLAMTLVVLPLSRTGAPSVLTWLYLVNPVQHGLMVALPIVSGEAAGPRWPADVDFTTGQPTER